MRGEVSELRIGGRPPAFNPHHYAGPGTVMHCVQAYLVKKVIVGKGLTP
jgi:hypothetical protein